MTDKEFYESKIRALKQWIFLLMNYPEDDLGLLYQKVKEGISKKDKEYLLDELSEMAKSIEEWKSNNPEDMQHKKAS